MSTKIDIQNPKKYFGKVKGDTELARVAHVNHAIKIAEENNGQLFPLDMPYAYYPEASQAVPSGTVIRYAGGPDWIGYKISGMVVPFGGDPLSGNFVWYLCSVKTKQTTVWGPPGIIPHSLTGMMTTHPQTPPIQGQNGAYSTLAKGAMVYNVETSEPAAVDNVYIQTSAWNDGTPDEDGFIYQDLVLVIETELPSYVFGCGYQFEFLVPEGTVVERFFD